MTNEPENNPKPPFISPPRPPGLFKTIFGRNKEMPEYGTLYFDHLSGEYQLLRHSIQNEEKEICESILAKRQTRALTWNEVYTFQMILLKHQDFETLKSRIISLRIKFQNLADANEYADYLTLRAVDLKRLDEAAVPEDDSSEHPQIENLRADLKYLIDEFYLRYAFIAARETLRSKLLRNGAIFTLVFALISAWFVILPFAYPDSKRYLAIVFPFTTLILVVFAGIMGAFVSMQERLQNTQSKGDPIYNLSLLTHGWLSIVLSPISGAIFAILLFLFFAGNILDGTIFPNMTEGKTIINYTDDTGKNQMFMNLKGFILGTHPATGKDYALLMIWSFVAGFAERFVPDTLMRVVNTKKTGNNPAA